MKGQATKPRGNPPSQGTNPTGEQPCPERLSARQQLILEKYTHLHRQADEQMLHHFNRSLREARGAFLVSWIMRVVFALVVVAILGVGLYIAWYGGASETQRLVGGGLAVVSLIVLWLAISHDPARVIRQTLMNLVQVNVIFLAYLRQMNQIDMAFRKNFEEKAASPESSDRLLDELRTTMQSTLLNIDELQGDDY